MPSVLRAFLQSIVEARAVPLRPNQLPAETLFATLNSAPDEKRNAPGRSRAMRADARKRGIRPRRWIHPLPGPLRFCALSRERFYFSR